MSHRSIGVGTEKFSRERFSVLPQTKTKFCQTDASWLRSRSVAVNTDVDPFFGVWKRRRVRGTYPFVSAAVQETQTDPVNWADASNQVRLCCDVELRKIQPEQEELQHPKKVEVSATATPISTKQPVAESKPTDQPQPVKEEHGKTSPTSTYSISSIDSEQESLLPKVPQSSKSRPPSPGIAREAVSSCPAVSPIPEGFSPQRPETPQNFPSPPPPISITPAKTTPKTLKPFTSKEKTPSTSDGNSRNPSESEEEEPKLLEKLKKVGDERRFFMKYAMRPRKTLKAIKAKSESRRSIRIREEEDYERDYHWRDREKRRSRSTSNRYRVREPSSESLSESSSSESSSESSSSTTSSTEERRRHKRRSRKDKKKKKKRDREKKRSKSVTVTKITEVPNIVDEESPRRSRRESPRNKRESVVEPPPLPPKPQVIRKISNVDQTTHVIPEIRKTLVETATSPIPSAAQVVRTPSPPKPAVRSQLSNPLEKKKQHEKVMSASSPNLATSSSSSEADSIAKSPIKQMEDQRPSPSKIISESDKIKPVAEGVDSLRMVNEDDRRMIIRVTNPREVITESKIVIEVINARRRETSEITSYSEMGEDGKITRKTTVTTSKRVPVMAIEDAEHFRQNRDQTLEPREGMEREERGSTFPRPRHPEGRTPEPIITSPPSTKAPCSPVPKDPKMKTTIESIAPSLCSTRPTSAAEDITIEGSLTSTPDVPRSSFLSPESYDEATLDKMAKRVAEVLDPYHMTMNQPTQMPTSDYESQVTGSGMQNASKSATSTLDRRGRTKKIEESVRRKTFANPTTTATIADRYNAGAKSPPRREMNQVEQHQGQQRRLPRVIWHETSSSTVKNEMITDAFVSDDGNIQRPRSVTMSSETLIDNSAKDSKLVTRSRAQRQFYGDHIEPEITSETSVSDVPPFMMTDLENPPVRRLSRPSIPPFEIPAVTAGPSRTTSTDPITTTAETPAKPKPTQIPNRNLTTSKIPTRSELSTSTPSLRSRERRGVSDPHLRSQTLSQTPAASTSQISSSKSTKSSLKSPSTFLESSLDDFDHIDKSPIPSHEKLLKRAGDLQAELKRSQEELSRASSRVSPGIDRKMRREQIRESARRGSLFSGMERSLVGKSLSFADLQDQNDRKSKETSTLQSQPSRKHSVDLPTTTAEKVNNGAVAKMRGMSVEHLNGKSVKSSQVPPPGRIKTTPSGTELTTRITRRTHPEEVTQGTRGVKEVIKPKRSKMVLEQDIKSGDGINDTDGCHMTSTITVDNPAVKKNIKKLKGLNDTKKCSPTTLNPLTSSATATPSFFGRLLRRNSSQQHLIMPDGQENDRESKEGDNKSFCSPSSSGKQFSKSMGDLRVDEEEDETEDDGQGVMITDTKFERLKPNPASGRNRNDTSWEYSMECNCVNGLNTKVRTNVKHKRSYVPLGLTLYESSV